MPSSLRLAPLKKLREVLDRGRIGHVTLSRIVKELELRKSPSARDLATRARSMLLLKATSRSDKRLGGTTSIDEFETAQAAVSHLSSRVERLQIRISLRNKEIRSHAQKIRARIKKRAQFVEASVPDASNPPLWSPRLEELKRLHTAKLRKEAEETWEGNAELSELRNELENLLKDQLRDEDKNSKLESILRKNVENLENLKRRLKAEARQRRKLQNAKNKLDELMNSLDRENQTIRSIAHRLSLGTSELEVLKQLRMTTVEDPVGLLLRARIFNRNCGPQNLESQERLA